MTPRQLRDDLRKRVGHLLGTYETPNGPVPALWLGEPPSDYKASGIEVRVSDDPELDVTPLLNREHHLRGVLTVRVVGWDQVSINEVVQRILSAWPLSQVAYIPASEDIGIINQATIRIPTA